MANSVGRVPQIDPATGRFPDRYAPESVEQDAAAAAQAKLDAQQARTDTQGIAAGVPAQATAAVASEVVTQVDPKVAAAAGSAGTAVQAKTDAAQILVETKAARDQTVAVGNTNDTIMAAVAANPGSAFAAVQNAAIEPIVYASPPGPLTQTYVASALLDNELIDNLAASSGYVYVIQDEMGRVALGIKPDGNVIAKLELMDGTVAEAKLTPAIQNSIGQELPVTSGYVWAITDSAGHMALGLRVDGTLEGTITKALNVPTAASFDPASYVVDVVTDGQGNRQLYSHDLNTGRQVKLTTSGDNYSPVINRAGIVVFARTGSTTLLSVPVGGGAVAAATSSDDIAWWGDSLTAPSTTGTTLATLTGHSVYNGGVGSQTSQQIFGRQGGWPITVTIAGNQIPASGPVSVTAIAPVDPSGYSANGTKFTLNGVQGALSSLVDGAQTFTRDASGSAITVAPGTRIIPVLGELHKGRTHVLWTGRNSIYNDPEASTIIPATLAGIDFMTGAAKRVAVVSITTATNEPAGHERHTRILAQNEALKVAVESRGAVFIDLLSYLKQGALSDLGITPTANDLACIAANTVPPSLMIAGSGLDGRDTIHFSTQAYTAIVPFIFNKLAEKGWY